MRSSPTLTLPYPHFAPNLSFASSLTSSRPINLREQVKDKVRDKVNPAQKDAKNRPCVPRVAPYCQRNGNNHNPCTLQIPLKKRSASKCSGSTKCLTLCPRNCLTN